MSFADETGITLESTIRMVEMGDKAWAADDKLIVKFYTGTRENTEETKRQGRPIFEEVTKVRILKPGERDYVDRPAWRGDFERFSKQYAAFKNGAEDAVSGTPLSVWPVIKASQVEELRYFNVKTVEQLAAMADVNAQKFMYGHGLRQAARDYVDHAKSQAPLIEMRAQLESRDSKIATLEGQMAQLLARATSLQPTAPAPAAMLAPDGAVPYRGPAPAPAEPAYDAAAIAAALGVPEVIAPAVAPKRRGRPPKASTL